MGKSLAIFLSFWCANSGLVGLSLTRQAEIAKPAAEGGLARNDSLAENIVARKTGLFIDFHKAMQKVVSNNPALRSGLSEVGTQHGAVKSFGRGGKESQMKNQVKESEDVERLQKRLGSAKCVHERTRGLLQLPSKRKNEEK